MQFIAGLLVGLAFWWLPFLLGVVAGYACRSDEEKRGIKPYGEMK
jgi:hypothetical protein